MQRAAAFKHCLRCLSQHGGVQHFPHKESAPNMRPRAVGLALQSSNQNQQQLLLIWLHSCRASQLGQKHRSESVKDLPLSLPLRVTLWNKIFFISSAKRGKRQFFQGMKVIEISGTATRCPCFLMSAAERGMRRVLQAGPGVGAQTMQKS